MKKWRRPLALAITLWLSAGCSVQRTNAPEPIGGVTCNPPPIRFESGAICLASRHAQQLTPAKLLFHAKEEANAWIVTFEPEADMLGGAGVLEVDKASGKITVLALHR